MKKLLSICFLSILLAALSFTAQAQVSTNCCFWLENLQPSTLTGLSNAPDGSGQLVLNNTMNPAVVGHTDYYKVRFNNNCNLPALTKVALDIKLYRNGILISDDPATLARYANFRVYTRWNDLTTSNTPGTVNCGQVSWFGGNLNRPGTCEFHGNLCEGGYPNAVQVHNSHPWSSTSALADGNFTLGSDGYDYFYLNFFENSENIIAITWNYEAPNGLSLVVGLRERTNGSANNAYFGNNEQDKIGGHGSCCGALLAQDSIHYLAKSHFEKEVCDGSTFDYGRPIHTFDTEGDYLVVFGDSTCDHFRIERLDTLHFFTRENPQVVVSTTHVERCFGHGITDTDLAGYASFATPDAAGLTYKEIQWSTDNINFTTTVPTPATAVGTYHYYVRQSNTYYNFLDSVVCEGPVTDITYIVNPIPETPVVNDREDFYCVDASNGVHAVTVEDHAVASTDCHLVWSKDRNFATTVSGLELVPDITTAGVTTYYVYQVNDVTGCVGLDLDHVDSIKVTVYDNPVVVTTVAPTFVCQGETIHVAVEPAVRGAVYTYAWADGRTVAGFDTVPAVGNHIYTVTAFEAHAGLDLDKSCRTTVNTIPDTVNYNPLKPILNPNFVDICNETIDENTTYTMNATVGEHGNTCVWYNEAGEEIARGNSYEVNVNSIKASSNVDTTVTYSVKSFNSETGCWSADADVFTFYLHTTPVLNEISANRTDSICPVSGNIVKLNVTLATETTDPYVYTWSGSVVASTSDATIMEITDQCDSVYAANVFVTDKFGCVSTPKSFSIIAKDHTPLTLSSYERLTELNGCADSIIPSAVTTIDDFQFDFATITNSCDDQLTISSVDGQTQVDADNCVSRRVRTYTIADHCGNSVQFVETFSVKDEVNPVIAIDRPQVLPVVRVADCKYDAPETSVLMSVLEGNISDNCASVDFLTNTVEFYFSGTDTRFEGARDLFADPSVNKVTVAAKITDRCGNSVTVDVIDFLRPEPMYIADGAAVSNYNYVCKQDPDMLNRDTVVLTFHPSMIQNATAPYTYEWSQIPTEGYIADVNDTLTVARPTLAGQKYIYTMKVTDFYGCTYSVKTDSVEVNDVITVNINKNTVNGNPWTEPICPNQLCNLTASCLSPGYWPASLFTFVWNHTEGNSHYTANNNIATPTMPNDCGGTEYYQVLATRNSTGCKAIGRVTVTYTDTVSPVINYAAISSEATVSVQAGCVMRVPDFTTFLNASNVADNCVDFANLNITQSPEAGSLMTQNTAVVVTVKDPCGNVSYMNFTAKIPANFLSVSADASNYAFCQDTVVTLTATPAHYYGSVSYAWTENGSSIGSANVIYQTPVADADEVMHQYIVVVTDANNCTATDTVTVTTYRKPVTSDVVLSSTKNTYCDNSDILYDGTVSASLTNGFQFRINSISSDWQADSYIYSGLYHGTYNVDVMTNHGCIVNNLASINVLDTNVSVIALVSTVPNTRCVYPFNGVITLNNVAAGYTYTLSTDSRTATDNSVINFSDLYFGQYTIQVVTDKYCEYTLNATVDSAAVIPVRPHDYNNPQFDCGRPNGTLSLTDGGVVEGYTFELLTGWPHQIITADAQDTVTFSGLTAGTYSVRITTPMACTAEFNDFVVGGNTFTPTEPVTTILANNACTPQLANGSITITDVHNQYTYILKLDGVVIDSVIAQNTANIKFDSLLNGYYTLKVYSEVSCEAEYVKEVLLDPIYPTFTAAEFAVTPRSSCSVPNGAITINAVPGYEYVVKDAGNHEVTNLATLTNADYTVYKKSIATGCVSDTTLSVGTSYYQSEYSITPTNNSWCNGTQFDGAFTFDNDSLSYTIKNASQLIVANGTLAAGTYTVTAVNSYSGCEAATHTAVITDDNQIMPLARPVSTPNYVCSNLEAIQYTGTVTFYPANNGAEIVTYSLGSDSNQVGYFETLFGGDYSYTLISDKGCKTNGSVTVIDSAFVPEMVVSHTDNYACAPIWVVLPRQSQRILVAGNGSITFESPIDIADANHYIYRFLDTLQQLNWNDASYNYLDAKTYNVEVIDTRTQCHRSQAVTINNDYRDVTVELVSTDNDVCSGVYTGTITANVNPSFADSYYTYTLSGRGSSQTSNLFTGLQDGDYAVTVLDTTIQCRYTGNVTVNKHDYQYDFTASTVDNNTICDGTPNGKITVNLAGTGMNPNRNMVYALQEVNNRIVREQRVSNVFDSLPNGDYLITVTDLSLGCSYTFSETISNDFTYPEFTLSATHNGICRTAEGDATISFTPATTYSYVILKNNVPVVNGSLAAGTYTVRGVDPTTNCFKYNEITVVDSLVFPNVTATATPNFRCDEANGTITLNVNNIADACTFQIGDDAHTATSQYTFVGLNSGMKTFKVTSSKGCLTTDAISVLDSAHIYNVDITTTPDYTCQNVDVDGTGTISFNVTLPAGHNFIGTLVSPSRTSVNNTFDKLYDGVYNFRITDQNTGCYINKNATVSTGTYDLSISLASVADSVCDGSHNGSIIVTASSENPAASFLYSLDGISYQRENVFAGKVAGKYGVTVMDSALKCTTVDSVVINKHDFTPSWNITPKANYNCTQHNGQLTVAFVEGTMPAHTYQYSINGGAYQTSNVFTGLTKSENAGGHQIMVKDMQTGCVYNTTADLIDSSNAPQVDLVSINYTKNPFHYCFGQTASFEARPTSSIPGDDCFTYSWNTDCWLGYSHTNTFDINSLQHSCDVKVVVTSCVTGCTTTVNRQITVDTLPVVKFFVDGSRVTSVPNIYYSCENEAHQISIQPTDVDSIQWNEAANYLVNVPSITAQPHPAPTMINYCVLVWDRNGCTTSSAASISVRYKDTTHTTVYDTTCATTTQQYAHNGKLTPVTYNTVDDSANEITFVDTLVNANGCDSIITTHLTLHGNPTIEISADARTAFNTPHCAPCNIASSMTYIYNGGGVADAERGWKVQQGSTPNILADADFDYVSDITIADNNKKVYAWVKNECSVAYTTICTLKVNAKPAITHVDPIINYCHGTQFGCNTPTTFNANVNHGYVPASSTWQISANGTDGWMTFDETSMVQYAHNGMYIRFYVRNLCGADSSGVYRLTVDTLPTATMTLNPTTYCAGDVIADANFSLISNGTETAPMTLTLLKLDGSYFYPGTTQLSYSDNGKYFQYVLTNRCGTGNSNTVAVTVNDVPTVDPITASSNLCRESYSISAPNYQLNGGTLSSTAWNLYDAASGGTAQTITADQIATLANSGKYLAYAVTNSCGIKESARLRLLVKDKPVVSDIDTVDVCKPFILQTEPSVNENNSALITASTGWQYKSGSGDWSAVKSAVQIQNLNPGNYQLRYHAVNECGVHNSNVVAMTIKDKPVVSAITAVNQCKPFNLQDAPSVNENNSALITASTGWQYKSGSGDWSAVMSAAQIQNLDPGNYSLRYHAQNACGEDNSAAVSMIIKDQPVINGSLSDDTTCAGAYSVSALTVTNNNSAITAQGFQIAIDTLHFAAWTTGSRLEYGHYQLRYFATNGCGTTYSDTAYITVNAKPVLTPSKLMSIEQCEGVVNVNNVSVDYRHTEPSTCSSTYRLFNGSSWSNWTNGSSLEYGNYKVAFIATNGCGITVSTDTVNIKINDTVVVSAPVVIDVCSDNFTSLTVPAIDNKGTAVTDSGWVYRSVGASSWIAATESTILNLDAANYEYAYYAQNECGSDTSVAAPLTIRDVPTLSTNTLAFDTICADGVNTLASAINAHSFVIDYHNGLNCSSKYEIANNNAFTSNVRTFDSLTVLISDLDGKYIRFKASNDCGDAYSSIVKFVVKSEPTKTAPTLSARNVCSGVPETFTAPSINWHHSNLQDAHFQISSDGTTFVDTTASMTFTYATSTSYAVRYVVSSDCVTDSIIDGPVTITVRDIPVANVRTLVDTTVCAGTYALPSFDIDWRGSTGTAYFKYGKNTTSTTSQLVGNNLPVQYGNYYNVILSATNACALSPVTLDGRVTIQVVDKPQLSGSTSWPSSVCAGENTLTVPTVNWKGVTDAADQYTVFELSTNGGFSWVDTTATIDFAYGTSYKVRFRAGNKCDTVTILQADITVKDVPTFDGSNALSNSETICESSHTFTAPGVNWKGDTGTANFMMSTNGDAFTSTTPEVNLVFGNTYYIRYEASNSCTIDPSSVMISGPDTITVMKAPAADGTNALVDTLVCAGEFTFEAPGVNWNNGIHNTSKFQIKVAENDYVDTAATMTFAYGTSYKVRFVASNDCASNVVMGNEVTVTVADKPVFDLAALTNVCEGHVISVTMPAVDLKGGTATDTTWTIGSETFKSDSAYAAGNYTITLSVSNQCGATTSSENVTVDTLPVPRILGDTVICESGAAVITANPGFVTYQWNVNGTPEVGATAQTFNYTSATSGVDTITVTVSDSHGCVSKVNANGNVDVDWGYYQSNAVTVKVSNEPHFIFRDANGNATHRLPSTVTSTTDLTNYSWTVANPCGDGAERIFVTFELYHNGQLIDNDSIGDYFNVQRTNTYDWINRQVISYYNQTPDNFVAYTMFYEGSDYHNNLSGSQNMHDCGNHFPFYSISSVPIHYYYLYVLSSRYVTNTMAPILTAGDYKVVYKMWRVGSHTESASTKQFYDLNTGSILQVGGTNCLYSEPTLLIRDSLMLTVTGEQLHSASPEPIPAPAVDEPVMSIYPNPTSDNFTAVIDGLEGNATVTIANNLGNVVFQETINIDQTQGYIYSHSMNDVQPGIYYVQIIAENGRITKKVVVAR